MSVNYDEFLGDFVNYIPQLAHKWDFIGIKLYQSALVQSLRYTEKSAPQKLTEVIHAWLKSTRGPADDLAAWVTIVEVLRSNGVNLGAMAKKIEDAQVRASRNISANSGHRQALVTGRAGSFDNSDHDDYRRSLRHMQLHHSTNADLSYHAVTDQTPHEPPRYQQQQQQQQHEELPPPQQQQHGESQHSQNQQQQGSSSPSQHHHHQQQQQQQQQGSSSLSQHHQQQQQQGSFSPSQHHHQQQQHPMVGSPTDTEGHSSFVPGSYNVPLPIRRDVAVVQPPVNDRNSPTPVQSTPGSIPSESYTFNQGQSTRSTVPDGIIDQQVPWYNSMTSYQETIPSPPVHSMTSYQGKFPSQPNHSMKPFPPPPPGMKELLNHRMDLDDIEDRNCLLRLGECVPRWKELGVKLGLPMNQINAIGMSVDSDYGAKAVDVLFAWVGASPTGTRQTLVDVLREAKLYNLALELQSTGTVQQREDYVR